MAGAKILQRMPRRCCHRRLKNRVDAVVVKNNKFGSLNMLNFEVVSDGINNNVDTRDIISCVKPDLFS